jgi:ATP-dependent RNA helicase DeaD
VLVVCTDVAARGLDTPSVLTIVHYDGARSVDLFVHRSGRTAVSFNFLSSVYACEMKRTHGDDEEILVVFGLESPTIQV